MVHGPRAARLCPEPRPPQPRIASFAAGLGAPGFPRIEISDCAASAAVPRNVEGGRGTWTHVRSQEAASKEGTKSAWLTRCSSISEEMYWKS